jgi:hypothetical protein
LETTDDPAERQKHLIGLVHDEVNPSAAMNYGLSLAAHARAHVTVQAQTLKLAMTHAVITDWAAELVNAENARRHEVAKAAVHKARQGRPCDRRFMHTRNCAKVET